MNRNSSAIVPVLVLALAVGFLPACKPSGKAPGSAAGRADRQPVEPVTVEMRDDGLAYLLGAAVPFTGDAITPFPDTPWLIKKKEPWENGKRNGEVREFFKNGGTKTLRRYENGLPKYACAYHKNGKMKFEINLNADDKAEGPYRRWYASGNREAEAGFDSQERWHGVSQEWTDAGELKSHLIFEHGVLKQIVFETEEGKAARIASGTELPVPKPS